MAGALPRDLDNLLAELAPQLAEVLSLRFGLEVAAEAVPEGRRAPTSAVSDCASWASSLAHLRRRQANVQEYR